jgi:Carbohydrate esterase, sialic acid-specific acetylesterase
MAFAAFIVGWGLSVRVLGDMGLLSRRSVLCGAAAFVYTPAVLRNARANDISTNVLQTVTASFRGVALPSSSGQIAPRSLAEEVIATNLKLAPKFGYRVDPDGSFTDPASGITILQGYVAAAPDYNIPAYPAEAQRPHPIEPETFGKGTFKLFVWGQSIAANCGHGRYSARNTDKTCVFSDGHFYPCSDPIVGADGPGGSVWSRFADSMLGRQINNSTVNQVVIGCCAQGGTSINDWGPGGSEAPRLLRCLSDYMTNVGQPTYLAYSQGESDVGMLSTEQWVDRWQTMLASVRNVGCTSKIYTSIETICNLRTANDPFDEDVIRETPDSYIKTEISRQNIRAAQRLVGMLGSDTRLGPNLDLIDWHLRACGDGCHFGELGLEVAAQACATALSN